jgi:hypothetical protein
METRCSGGPVLGSPHWSLLYRIMVLGLLVLVPTLRTRARTDLYGDHPNSESHLSSASRMKVEQPPVIEPLPSVRIVQPIVYERVELRPREPAPVLRWMYLPLLFQHRAPPSWA